MGADLDVKLIGPAHLTFSMARKRISYNPRPGPVPVSQDRRGRHFEKYLPDFVQVTKNRDFKGDQIDGRRES